jgi:ribosomal protein S9
MFAPGMACPTSWQPSLMVHRFASSLPYILKEQREQIDINHRQEGTGLEGQVENSLMTSYMENLWTM